MHFGRGIAPRSAKQAPAVRLRKWREFFEGPTVGCRICNLRAACQPELTVSLASVSALWWVNSHRWSLARVSPPSRFALRWATSALACHPKLVLRRDVPTFAASPLWWASFACIHERRMVDQTGIEPVTS